MRKSTPNSDFSYERFTAGENQEILLQEQNCIQEARTVFQNSFCYLAKHRFLSSTYAGQKEEAYRK